MTQKLFQTFRDPDLAGSLVNSLHRESRRPLRLMEVCGTHTMSIFRHGIRDLLPPSLTLLTGPGCPVCVTSRADVDVFVSLAREPGVIVTTFGDLMRVPGSDSSLARESALGADVRMVYSVGDAVAIACRNPGRTVVFCGVGFETTIPTLAAGILMAEAEGATNFLIHSAAKLTPPALAALMATEAVSIDGFILPGHVSVITGTRAFQEVFDTWQVPAVIAGFEPVDILDALLRLVRQNESGTPALENAYSRAVSPEGNPRAREVMHQVFSVTDAVWRGIGTIPGSGMALNPDHAARDAAARFSVSVTPSPEPAGCSCGRILMGLATPEDCLLFRNRCTPMTPVGPCMVSGEGACAAYYKYR